jgi:hypothetical protein
MDASDLAPLPPAFYEMAPLVPGLLRETPEKQTS